MLSALRPLTRGKLILVFGCGGNRDRTKRPRMAAVAEKWADSIIVTSDNPRNEVPSAIIDEILTGFTEAGRAKSAVQEDRREAIGQAIASAGAGDIVLIAGKGHENYQILGSRKVHFDDVETAGEFLRDAGCRRYRGMSVFRGTGVRPCVSGGHRCKPVYACYARLFSGGRTAATLPDSQ